MIFLGQASNYRFGQVLRHLFARGSAKDSQALKRALAQRYQVEKTAEFEPEERVELYHTGRSALAAAIMAVTPRHSKVILPGMTCIAVVRAIRAAGCEPVFVDINPRTLQYDWDQLETVLQRENSTNTSSKSAKKTGGLDKTLKVCYNVNTIVAQNTLGLPLDMSRLEKIAQKYHLQIVEDLAHCAGRFYADGREIGQVGVATALSFGKGKSIDTISGGAMVLRSAKYVMPSPPRFRAKRSARWRERWYPALGAIMRAGAHVGLGKIFTAIFLRLGWIERSGDAELNLDVKLSHWQARLALRQLEALPRTTKQQAQVWRGIQVNSEMVYPLREFYFVKQRERFLAECKKHGFYLDDLWYDAPVGPARCAKEANFPVHDCPNTVKVARTIINLPTWYPEEKLSPVRELMQPYLLLENISIKADACAHSKATARSGSKPTEGKHA